MSTMIFKDYSTCLCKLHIYTLKFYFGNARQILFVCFVALRPKSTAMVMEGQSVHLTTLFSGQA